MTSLLAKIAMNRRMFDHARRSAQEPFQVVSNEKQFPKKKMETWIERIESYGAFITLCVVLVMAIVVCSLCIPIAAWWRLGWCSNVAYRNNGALLSLRSISNSDTPIVDHNPNLV